MQDEVPGQRPSRSAIRQALKAWSRTDELGALQLAKSPLVTSQRQKHGYSDSASGRGLALREVLSTAIESMGPDGAAGDLRGEREVDLADKRWRPYFILRERFIAGRNLAWIAAQLHISQRTCQYEQTRALDMLADSLRQARVHVHEQDQQGHPVRTRIVQGTTDAREAVLPC